MTRKKQSDAKTSQGHKRFFVGLDMKFDLKYFDPIKLTNGYIKRTVEKSLEGAGVEVKINSTVPLWEGIGDSSCADCGVILDPGRYWRYNYKNYCERCQKVHKQDEGHFDLTNEALGHKSGDTYCPYRCREYKNFQTSGKCLRNWEGCPNR